MSWIDYKNAYDMVPHLWIKEIVSITRVAGNIGKLKTNSMEKWGTLLTTNGEQLGKVIIKRVIFQGDLFSPLLFVMAMIPLTLISKKVEAGFQFSGNMEKLNYLLLIDDIKLYGKDETELDRLVGMIKEYSDDIGIKFGLEGGEF